MEAVKPEIGFPNHLSEFEIQADLYSYLKENNMNVRGEVSSFDYITTLRGKQRKPRFDLVVYDWDNNPKCIIEVKRSIRHRSKALGRYKVYVEYGVDIICVYADTNFQSVLHLCSEIINSNRQPQMYRI